MDKIILLIRFTALIASFIGIIFYFIDRINIKAEFAPVVAFSSIICLLFISGILNMLQLIAYIIMLFGCIYLAYFILSGRILKMLKVTYTSVSYTILTLIFIAYAYLLRNTHLYHIDNFTHWSLVIKDILYNDQLRSTSTNIVTFITYPPASALFVYYGSQITVTSEVVMLIMQLLFMISCLLPLFAFSKKNRINTAIITLLCITLLITDQMVSLQVDLLLGLIGLAGSLIIIYYRDNIKEAFIYVLPVLIATVLVKNSGIYFLVLNVFLMIYFACMQKERLIRRNNYKYIVLSLVIPIFVIFVWSQHAELLSPNQFAPHEMSLKNYISHYNNKTGDNVLVEIGLLLLNKQVDFTNILPLILLLTNSIIIIFVLTNRKSRKTLLKCLIYIDISYIIYIIGVYGMYVFSMTSSGSLILAGYNRYIITLIVYIIPISIIALISSIDYKIQKTVYIKQGVMAIAIIISLVVLGNKPFAIRDTSDTVSARFDEVINVNNEIYDESKYIVYDGKSSSNNDTGYMYHISRYKIFAPDVVVANTNISDEEFEQLLRENEKILVLYSDERVDMYLSRSYDNDEYLGVYEITKEMRDN